MRIVLFAKLEKFICAIVYCTIFFHLEMQNALIESLRQSEQKLKEECEELKVRLESESKEREALAKKLTSVAILYYIFEVYRLLCYISYYRWGLLVSNV